jgi:hypothetical protein
MKANPAAAPEQEAEGFWRDAEAFYGRAEALGFPDIRNYYWYHTVELPGGLVTPGQYDFRESIAAFPFPADLRGARVLDIGSATGFFAFEFARRGAEVTSLELPSLEALDRFPGQDVGQSLEKIRKMMGPRSAADGGSQSPYTAEEMYFYLLEGPFEFCRKQLGARIGRCYSTVYDLTEAKAGGTLCAVAPLCRGTLVLSQRMPETADGEPAMLWVGGDSLSSDEVSWWLPNQACLVAVLKKLGFRTVVNTGSHSGALRPSGYPYTRAILRAEK